jgi:glycosyltransferase involved in cell wall biosynthesis
VLSLRTDAVISFDENKAQLIRARERVKTFEIIRNGIPIDPVPSLEKRELARRALGVSRDTIVFGVVASLQTRKNPSLALRSFAQLADENGPPIRLDFFGDGALRASLEEEARALGVSEYVRFHGFRSDVREFLGGLDVFLTLATQEMAPISMLEAMAARISIIGAPHPGTIEMIEDGINGLIVDWDVARISTAMRFARDTPAWRHQSGSAGRALVEKQYDIEDIATRHVAFYRRLMLERARRCSAGLAPAELSNGA